MSKHIDQAWRALEARVKGGAMNPRNVADIPHEWKFIQRLHKPDGHKLYMDLSTGLFAIADNSGRYPDETDDGILWLLPDQELEVDMGTRRLWVPVAVYAERDGRNARFGTNFDGALFLAEKFRWTLTLVSPEGKRIKVK